jgi:hypothetical protein
LPKHALQNTFYSLIVVVVFLPLVKLVYSANFGMIDDHRMLSIVESTESIGLLGQFTSFFPLQDYGETKRFQPSQLAFWGVQSFFFKTSPVLWYGVPVLLCILSGLLLLRVLVVQKGFFPGLIRVNASGQKILNLSILLIFLSLPIWRTNLNKLGVAEVFTIPLTMYLFYCVLKVISRGSGVQVILHICLVSIALVGLRENNFVFGAVPSVLFFFSRHKLHYKEIMFSIFTSLVAASFTVWVTFGWILKVWSSGSDIYANETGLSRLFSAYQFPIFDASKAYLLCLIVFTIFGLYLLSRVQQRSQKLLLKILLSSNLVIFLIDSYMFGLLFSGHYSNQRFLFVFLLGTFELLFVLDYFFQKYFRKEIWLSVFGLFCGFTILFGAIAYTGNLNFSYQRSSENEVFNSILKEASQLSTEEKFEIVLISSNPYDYEPIFSTAFNINRLNDSKVSLLYKAAPNDLDAKLPDFATRKMLDAELSSISKSGNPNWLILANTFSPQKKICIVMPNTRDFIKDANCTLVRDFQIK